MLVLRIMSRSVSLILFTQCNTFRCIIIIYTIHCSVCCVKLSDMLAFGQQFEYLYLSVSSIDLYLQTFVNGSPKHRLCT